MGRSLWHVLLLVLALSVLVPAGTFAQSGIAGVVRDATGAVLPGVTVEATSPALIEKVRSAVTDSAGLNSAASDLRPGIYTVKFTLTGFATLQRQGIELPSSFTATVNAEMRVGDLVETITVLGPVPQVDIQSVTKSTVLSDELLNSIPAVRLPHSYVLYVPGVTGTIIGSQLSSVVSAKQLAIHGGRTSEFYTTIDGSVTQNVMGPGGPFDRLYLGTAVIEDLNIELGGLSAEHKTGGIYANVIPKEGSNTFSGFLFASYANENLQGSNLTNDLRAAGVTFNPGIKKMSDVNPAFGGRILRDKLWFYSAFRHAVSNQYVAGIFYNKTPLAWTYTPDLTRPATFDVSDKAGNTRLTWQATPKNKISCTFL